MIIDILTNFTGFLCYVKLKLSVCYIMYLSADSTNAGTSQDSCGRLWTGGVSSWIRKTKEDNLKSITVRHDIILLF